MCVCETIKSLKKSLMEYDTSNILGFNYEGITASELQLVLAPQDRTLAFKRIGDNDFMYVAPGDQILSFEEVEIIQNLSPDAFIYSEVPLKCRKFSSMEEYIQYKQGKTGYLPAKRISRLYASKIYRLGTNGIELADEAVRRGITKAIYVLKNFSGFGLIPEKLHDRLVLSETKLVQQCEGYCWKNLDGYTELVSNEKFVRLEKVEWYEKDEKMFTITGVVPILDGPLIRSYKLYLHLDRAAPVE